MNFASLVNTATEEHVLTKKIFIKPFVSNIKKLRFSSCFLQTQQGEFLGNELKMVSPFIAIKLAGIQNQIKFIG